MNPAESKDPKEIRAAQVEAMTTLAVSRFRASPLFIEAEKDGWDEPLHRYALAVANYQANLLTRTPADMSVSGVDVLVPVFGQDFAEIYAEGSRDAAYLFQQWQRVQHQLCVTGNITIKVPLDQVKRLKEAAGK